MTQIGQWNAQSKQEVTRIMYLDAQTINTFQNLFKRLFESCLKYTNYYICVLYRESKSKEEYDGIDLENLVTLEKLKQSQRQDYLKVSAYTMHVNSALSIK